MSTALAATSTDLATLKAKQIAEGKEPKNPVANALMKATGAMKAVLPRHITPERMSRMALGILRTNKKLREVAHANPDSFVHAVVQASQIGLEIGVFGEAHLVPFKDEIVMIPGYQGLVKLVKNSGAVVDIYAHEVRANDKFKLLYGLNRDLQHEPLNHGGFPAPDDERGPIVGFYAVAVYKDGTRTFTAMGLPQIHKVRDESRGYQMAKQYKKESPWDTQFTAMGCKTVVRRLCNWLPKSAELQRALDIDAAAEAGKRATIEGEFVRVDGDDDDGSSPRGDGGAAKQGADTKEVTDKRGGGAQDGQSGIPDPNADDLIRQLQAVKSKEAADAVLDLANGLPADAKARVKQSYDNRLEVLEMKPDGGATKGSPRKASME